MVQADKFILIVEDDPGIARLARERLERKGYSTATSRTGSEALLWLQQWQPDLLILDCILPDMTGQVLLDRLDGLNKVPPFIATASPGCDRVAAELVKRGAEGYITIDDGFADILAESVDRALRQCETTRRLDEAETELSERARLNEVLLDALPCEALLLNAQGTIVAANANARQAGFVPGQNCAQVRSGDCRPCSFCRMPQAFDSGTTQKEEVQLADRCFDYRWIPLENGLCLHYATDITDQKAAEAERHKLTEQFRQMQKMEAIGQLAGGVAHDFNNLLTGIIGYAQLQKRFLPPDNQACKYSQTILNTAERAQDLTQSLLTFARKNTLQIAPTDLHEVLTETVKLLRTTCKNVKIVTDLLAEDAIVMGDRSQLQTSLLNLGINAGDAMPSGGTLTFRTSTIQADPNAPASLDDAPASGYLRVEVTDTGTGIDPEMQKKIFEPFFTTKQAGKGTGLGLSSVYGCIRSHKGAIDVASEPGNGTTFTVLLPLPAAKPALAAPESLSALPNVPSARLMIVDDDAMVRGLAEQMLADLGHTTAAFSDGPAALNHYRQHSPDIDLVLLDVAMPEMDGREVFQRLCEMNPDVRVLFLTGFAAVDLPDPDHPSLVGVLRKPFRIEQLCRHLAEILTPRQKAS